MFSLTWRLGGLLSFIKEKRILLLSFIKDNCYICKKNTMDKNILKRIIIEYQNITSEVTLTRRDFNFSSKSNDVLFYDLPLSVAVSSETSYTIFPNASIQQEHH